MRQSVGRLIGLVLSGVAGSAAGAQTHRVAAPEKVVRAVGVYEWTGELKKPTASRLVPVSIFIDGQLQDAGVYLPQPIPFALAPGNEYELEHAGIAQALFQLDYARHLQTADLGDVDSWFGYGSTRTEAAKKAPAALHPARTPGVITSSASDRPTLTRKTDADGSAGGSATPVDPDRPTMKRRNDSGSNPGTDSSGGTATTSGTPAEDPDRPTLRRRTSDTGKKSKPKDEVASVTSAEVLGTDPDRPTLHRGRPAGAASAAGETEPPKMTGTPADLHQVAAVSDAATRPEHDFARAWTDDTERTTVLGAMQGLARAQLASYAAGAGTKASVAKATGATTKQSSASPAGTTARARAAARARARAEKAVAAQPVVLLEEQLKAYTLSYGGAATYVYTAHTAGTGVDLRYVTMVAQAEVTGDLKPALSSVTDAAHLDRTPWMRFVDVVDAEASNRASLLFEMRGQSGRQFALYRVLGDRADQLLATGTAP